MIVFDGRLWFRTLRCRVPHFQHQIFVASPPHDVFEVIADVTTHPQWQQGLLRSELLGDDPVGTGQKGVEVRRILGLELRFPYQITVYSPPRAWGFRVLKGPLRLAAKLTLKSERSGTLIESDLHLPGLLGWLLGRSMLSQQRDNYIRLKSLVEGRARKAVYLP
jgi:hypothetical protein